jgi:hypothetical protein
MYFLLENNDYLVPHPTIEKFQCDLSWHPRMALAKERPEKAKNRLLDKLPSKQNSDDLSRPPLTINFRA